jgi:hypothetical protein
MACDKARYSEVTRTSSDRAEANSEEPAHAQVRLDIRAITMGRWAHGLRCVLWMGDAQCTVSGIEFMAWRTASDSISAIGRIAKVMR